MENKAIELGLICISFGAALYLFSGLSRSQGNILLTRKEKERRKQGEGAGSGDRGPGAGAGGRGPGPGAGGREAKGSGRFCKRRVEA